MQYKTKFGFRFVGFMLSLMMMSLTVLPTLAADPPLIRVSPQWRPASTLDSVDVLPLNVMDAGDDFRYVEADIYVTASVQFWTAQLTCTVTPAATAPTNLTSYETPDIFNADPGDDVASVRWGAEWGGEGNDFTAVVEPMTAAGARRFTAARHYGPMGSNGYNLTFLLATLRYRAKDIAAGGIANLNCTSTFLNKDGRAVLTPVYVAPPPLKIITGYTITAKASYQGRTSSAGISMACDNDQTPMNPDFTMTSATGNFTYNALRQQGWYVCDFFGNVTNAAPGYQPDTFLLGNSWFNLTGSSYQFLPFQLMGGNVERNNISNTDGNPSTPDEIIDGADLGVITAPNNWEKVASAGDVNGDTKTDEADLSLAAGNFGNWEGTILRHAIYSLPRSWDSHRNSRIWLGGEWSGPVTQFVPGAAKDYWATLSPDGTRLAFIRGVGPADCPHCETALFVAPISNLGVVGTPVRLSVNWYPNNYAPSWSPDGTQIAFSCSWWGENGSGYLFDDGHLCMVDANGRNLRTVAQNARIYPPAWYINNAGETYLVYGGSTFNNYCGDTLCMKNPATPEWYAPSVLDFDIPAGTMTGNIADMPRICNMQGCDHLFYRFSSGGTSILRWAQIDLNTNDIAPFEIRAAADAPYHMNVEYDMDGDDPGETYDIPSVNVDYYTVAQNNYEIVFTESLNSWNFYNLGWDATSLGSIVRWFGPGAHSVLDSVPNIDPVLPGEPSERYALRNTVDIVP